MISIKKLIRSRWLCLWLPIFTALMVCIDFFYFTVFSSKKLFEVSLNQKYDMVVVPGVPYQGKKWSKIMKARVYWSKYLFEKGIAQNIMYSGSSVYTPYNEAQIMALYAEAIGIPKNHIFVETKAEHSTENIYYSYKKSKKMGFKTIALASDPFQTKMLGSFCKEKLQDDVKLIPIVFEILKALEPQMKDPEIDSQKAYNPQFIALPERESWWKRLQGTLGKNIDFSNYQ